MRLNWRGSPSGPSHSGQARTSGSLPRSVRSAARWSSRQRFLHVPVQPAVDVARQLELRDRLEDGEHLGTEAQPRVEPGVARGGDPEHLDRGDRAVDPTGVAGTAARAEQPSPRGAEAGGALLEAAAAA